LEKHTAENLYFGARPQLVILLSNDEFLLIRRHMNLTRHAKLYKYLIRLFTRIVIVKKALDKHAVE